MTDTAASEEAAVDAPAPQRIATLDIVRGIAVMGILAMNIVAFAMPFQAYVNPLAYGMESSADLASWIFSFILIDGKMRGLFSFLFGASTLLVIERAKASGQSSARVHYMRMIWLLIFGCVHFYLIWFGDILTGYAMMGLLLFLFRDLSVKALIRWGIGFLLIQLALMGSAAGQAFYLAQASALPNADPALITEWREMSEGFAPLTRQQIAENLALFQGSWAGLVRDRFFVHFWEPWISALSFGAETLGYMLFGMAALKSGFFRGDWDIARYRKWAVTGFAIGIPAYAVMAWLLVREGFAAEWLFALWLAASTAFRPVMIVAIAALIVILTRNGGALTQRIAAAGRAAFTNYLGTSILMTTFFYGYGLGFYGTMSRAELWLVVIAMWALMLLWSKPWLDRYQYGPFEWLWRSAARMKLQPMRKSGSAG